MSENTTVRCLSALPGRQGAAEQPGRCRQDKGQNRDLSRETFHFFSYAIHCTRIQEEKR